MTLDRKTPLIRKTPLKRTELKRGKSELKRSPFQHRSGPLPRRREKPRPLSNADLYESYRQRFGDRCEVSFWSGLVIRDGELRQERVGNLIDKHLERHHLWSVGRRPDFRSNLLTCTEAMHDWGHAHQPQIRTIGVWCKLRKQALSGEPGEFTLSEIDRAAGKCVAGVIECYVFESELLRDFQYDAVRWMERLTTRGDE